MKRLLSLLMLAFFLLGALPLSAVNAPSAGARVKKKIYRRARGKKKLRQAKRKKVARKKTPAKKAVASSAERRYLLPARAGTISQKYYLEEGADEAEAENIVKELKALGADESSVDVEKNTLRVKYNTKELSSISIIKKLKELGYTVKRID